MNNLTPKLTPEDVEEMQRLWDEGATLKDIAQKFKVSECTVSEKTKPKFQEDPNWRSKARWPEWELWRNLHKRYGKKAGEQNPHK